MFALARFSYAFIGRRKTTCSKESAKTVLKSAAFLTCKGKQSVLVI